MKRAPVPRRHATHDALDSDADAVSPVDSNARFRCRGGHGAGPPSQVHQRRRRRQRSLFFFFFVVDSDLSTLPAAPTENNNSFRSPSSFVFFGGARAPFCALLPDVWRRRPGLDKDTTNNRGPRSSRRRRRRRHGRPRLARRRGARGRPRRPAGRARPGAPVFFSRPARSEGRRPHASSDVRVLFREEQQPAAAARKRK